LLDSLLTETDKFYFVELKKGEEFLEHQSNDPSRNRTPSDDLYSVISRRGDHSRSRTDVSIEDNDTLSILGEVVETADILITKSDQELPVEVLNLSRLTITLFCLLVLLSFPHSNCSYTALSNYIMDSR
jgi:hypothetical protein